MTIAEKLKKAKEDLAAAQGKLKELRTKATGGNWDSDKDGTTLDSLEAEVRAATKEADQFQRMLNQEEEEMRSGGAGRTDGGNAPNSPVTVNILEGGRKPDTIQRHRQEFRLLKACRQSLDGGRMDGIEAEVHQEGQRDAENRSVGLSGGIILPPYMVTNMERRDLTAGSATSMGNVIATSLAPEMIPFLNPQTSIRRLGARYMTGLTDNLDYSRKTARAIATWKTEVAAASEITNTTDKVQMTPKRLPAFTEVADQLLRQASIDVENDVRADLNFAVEQALEVAAINGSGVAPIPTGILNTSGIGDVPLGTNGAVPVWANIVALETLIATANANGETLGYLTTPGIAGLLKTLKRDVAGNGFIWEGPNYPYGMVNGYKAATSTLVPSTLTKGSSSVCHAVIFGNWNELIIGQWGGIQIIVNPYARDTESIVRITINSFWDVAVRHAASFAAIKDALLS
jgi:HK97 family phage major capsid protein